MNDQKNNDIHLNFDNDQKNFNDPSMEKKNSIDEKNINLSMKTIKDQPTDQAGLSDDDASNQPSPADENLEIIKKLNAENTEMQNKYLRAIADMENLRARHKREIDDVKQTAINKFAKEILAIGDQLSLALQSCAQMNIHAGDDNEHARDNAVKAIIEGIKMTDNGFLETLKKFDITRFDSLGEKFDHTKHQAIMEQPSNDIEPGYILKVLQDGYMQKDRLLRPAMVIVAKAV